MEEMKMELVLKTVQHLWLKNFYLFLITPVLVLGGTFKEITDFGDNPGSTKMFLYTPEKLVTNPPILVAIHWCSGTANAIYTSNNFSPLADQFGFLVIFPDANTSDGCWEVHSQEALTHNGGSDPLSIVSMVRYVVKNKKADSTRVFATGVSSGAMMTNVLLGSYPDIFKAGAAFAGVPFGCFAGPNAWNSECSQGKISKTAEEWGDLVRTAYPTYTGPRPRMQLWHGTKDDVLYFNNFKEEIKQWTNVLGISQTPTTTENNTPTAKWIRTRYANSSGVVMVEAIEETDLAHNLQVKPDQAISFFGLDKPVSVNDHHIFQNIANKIKVTRKNNGILHFYFNSITGPAKFEIFDTEGKMIVALLKQNNPSGIAHFSWNGVTNQGNRCTSGVYILKVRVCNSNLCSVPFTLY
jgi:poly(hydroxyalkanoate) depolymerase family esterase